MRIAQVTRAVMLGAHNTFALWHSRFIQLAAPLRFFQLPCVCVCVCGVFVCVHVVVVYVCVSYVHDYTNTCAVDGTMLRVCICM